MARQWWDNIVTQGMDNNVNTPNSNYSFDDYSPTNTSNGLHLGETSNLGLNTRDWFNVGAGALNTLGSLYLGYEQNKMAKRQFNQKLEMWNKSWNAKSKAYNTRLEDKYSARYGGMSDAQRMKALTPKDYVAKNKIV